jgi:LacI family transcriptional regulator
MGKSILDFVKENKITAIFRGHDELAIGLMSYCYDNNIKIPEDISICGFGDKSIASIYRPRLTTVREPFYDIGAVAIRSVIKKIKGEELEEDKIVLPYQIIKRESCAKAKNKEQEI